MEQIMTILKGFGDQLYGMIPPVVIEFYQSYSIPMLIALIALCVAISLEGYKIFKGLLYIVIPTGLSFVGFKFLAGIVMSNFGSQLPALPLGITYDVAISVVLAIIGVFLVKFAYKFTVMLLGGGVGFVLGYLIISGFIVKMFPTLAFLNTGAAKIIIGLVFAAMIGIVFILFFKHLYILITSLGFMALAGFLAATLIIPAAPITYKLVAVGLGLAVGIYSTIHQYNEEQRSQDIRFYT